MPKLVYVRALTLGPAPLLSHHSLYMSASEAQIRIKPPDRHRCCIFVSVGYEQL